MLIKPQKFGDDRGFFMETYRQELFSEHGINDRFVQDNLSFSRQGTIRGLHYQIKKPQAKLVMVTRGRILDVAVDIRQHSPTFGGTVQMELDAGKPTMLYIPVGFAHGFEVLSKDALFMYKCSDYYHPEGECGIAWDDPELDIAWHTNSPLISNKDRQHPVLSQVPPNDLFK